MTETKPILIVVAAALIDPDNRILIQERPTHKPYAGFWEFPGGKLEQGETPEAALVRELHEEIGITTVEKALFPLTFVSGGYPDFHVVNIIYGCRNWTGVPQSLEGQQMAWVKPARLNDYNLLDKNRDAVPFICALV